MTHIPENDAQAGPRTATVGVEGTVEDLEPLDVVERKHVLKVLRAVHNKKAVAARILGIGRKTLYRMLDRWRIAP